MPTASDAIDAAIKEVSRARSLVSRIKGKQVRGTDALEALKATAQTWFNTHRHVACSGTASTTLDLSAIDRHYTTVLDSTARFAARRTYLDALRDAKNAL